MIPILFNSDFDPDILFESGGGELYDTADEQLYAAEAVGADRTFSSHGIGDLADTTSCYVEEIRNSSYELEMEYPIDGIHFEDIALRMIILAKPNYTDDPQPFRIYKITKPINGICTIYARHISYDMSGIAVEPFTASNLPAALSGLTAHAINTCPFSFSTTRTTAVPFTAKETGSLRSWIGGREGSLLDVYGGEWHFDKFTATLENSRGEDRGVVINYGHNLMDLEQDENTEEVYTGCVAVWIQDDVETRGEVQFISSKAYEKVYVLDVSMDFETAPTLAQLNAKAIEYLQNHNKPEVNITLDFVQAETLSHRVDLCDTVQIYYEDLGVSATAKCIRTKWDVLLGRYEETEFGDARADMADTISNTVKAVEKAVDKSQMDTAISRASQLITGNLGGYVVIHDSDGDGNPDEVLIMDTPDITTATKVWRWNASGLGYSSTGYNGEYGLAMTIDGEIVADFITTGTLDASEVDVENLNADNITSGTLSASKISGGTLTLGGANNVSGVMQVLDADGNVIGTWDNNGIDIDKGAISIGNNFSVDNTGALTASNATIGSSGVGYSAKVEQGQVSLYYGTDFVGRIMCRRGSGTLGNISRFESGPNQHAYVQLSDTFSSAQIGATDGTDTSIIIVSSNYMALSSDETRISNANFLTAFKVGSLTWPKIPVINLTTPSFNSLPKTYYSSYITAEHEVPKGCGIELSNTSAQTSDWTITTGDGFITINGSISGSTTAKLTLVAPTVSATATTS